MNKFQKLSLVGAVSSSFLIAHGGLAPYRSAWAMAQDPIDEAEARGLAGSLNAIAFFLLDDTIEMANDDNYLVNSNTQLTVSVEQGIFANDEFDNPVDFVLLENVTNGLLALELDGSFTYLPGPNFVGVDTFRYALTMPNGETSEATVRIRVNGQPQAVNDNFSTTQDTRLTGNVVTNLVGGSDTLVDGADVDPVTDAATSLGGTISIDADGEFTFDPPAGTAGVSDTYVYTLRDQDDDTSTATITVVINGAPINLNPSMQTVDEDTVLAFNALNNNQISVSDPDSNLVGVTLSVASGILSVTPAGAVSVSNSGTNSVTLNGSQDDINATLASLSYQATPEYNGPDTLTISSTDATGLSDADSVAITVTPVSDGVPVAVDDNFFTGQDQVLVDNVILNGVGGSDTIFDEADVEPVINAPTTRGGSITISADGAFTYTPPAGVTGGAADTFVYSLVDSDGQSDTATISIGIAVPRISIPNSDAVGPNSDDILVLENTTVDGTFSLATPVGFGGLQIGTNMLTEIQLTMASPSAPINITGVANGTLQIIGFSGGVVTYRYDPTGDSQDHSSATNDVLSESLAIVLTDANSESVSDTLNIGISDTNPVANDDARSISEGTSAIAGNLVGISGAASGDVQDVLVDPNSTPVTDFDSPVTGDGTPGSFLIGSFGSLVINSAGVYTFNLDDTNTDVQGLKGGESLVEVFNYTITDGDGDTDTASISTTINGVEDAAPTISVADNNSGATGEHSVIDATGAQITGQFTITATAGADLLTVSGQDITNASPSTTVDIAGDEGVLTITNYNASTGVVSYQYVEDGDAEDHSVGEILDNFAIVVVDNEGDSASDSLDIQIVDSVPTAVADSNSITEDAASNTVSANVITGGAGADSSGGDTPITVSAVIGGTVGASVTGSFGSLVINSDGLYTYTLDNNNSSVQALNSSQSESDTFSYTITDADGDTSSTTLTITINGADEPPTITIPNNNSVGPNNDDLLTAENAVNGAGSFTVEAEAGLTSLQIGSTTLTLLELNAANITPVDIDGELRGALQITAYNSVDGLTSYNYDPTGTSQDHSSATNDVLSEALSIIVTDNDGETATETLNIGITDTAPTAAADTNSITEDATPNTSTGDVITNDTQGADTSVSISAVDFGGSQTVGTPFSSDFGTLDLNSDGTYTYTLTNSLASVQALNSGESLTESFNYSIQDADGDTSSSTLTVTINGVNEAPLVNISDNNGGAIGDESVAENLTTSSFFTISSLTGLNPLGTALSLTDEQTDTLTLTLSQLQNLGTANQVINSGDGTLALTNYNLAANVSTISYTFDPVGIFRDHSGGDDSVVDTFSIVVTDANNNSGAAQDLDILITDTSPDAMNDARSISEGTARVSGNAVGGPGAGTGDVADTIIDPVTVTDIDFGANDGTVGTPLNGDFGSLLISSSGVYTYTLDNMNSDVQNLNGGESLVETFIYTITDNEAPNADSDTATITVTINGVTSLPSILASP